MFKFIKKIISCFVRREEPAKLSISKPWPPNRWQEVEDKHKCLESRDASPYPLGSPKDTAYRHGLDSINVEPFKKFLQSTNTLESTLKNQLNIALTALTDTNTATLQICDSEDRYIDSEAERIYHTSIGCIANIYNEAKSNCRDTIRIYDPKALHTGFLTSHWNSLDARVAKQVKEAHLIRWADLDLILRNKTAEEYANEQSCEKLASANKSEKRTDELIGEFVTTLGEHELGPGLIGIIELYRAALPTVLGGTLHPLPSPYRYTIIWVHPRSRNRSEELFTSHSLNQSIKNHNIRFLTNEEIDAPPIIRQGF